MEQIGKNYTANTTIAKLIVLYVFDKMEIPLTESTVLNLCCNKNDWVNYMTCKEVVSDLIDIGFLNVTTPSAQGSEPFYSITEDGRACLSYFFIKIPSSLREDISEYIKVNRLNFRRMQEYFKDYYKNADGTYSVVLRIMEPSGPILEIKMNVANRSSATSIYKKWEEKASEVFASLHDTLID